MQYRFPLAFKSTVAMTSRSRLSRMEKNDEDRTALIFLGTGCSGAVPEFRCLLQPSDPPCHVCSQSLSLLPHLNPNYRCNTSLLIDYCCEEENGRHYYIIIDVGKSFREQVLRWFTFYKIPRIDSIILTHEHADAIHGLDDIRSFQPRGSATDTNPLPVFLSQFTMESISTRFPYLVEKKAKQVPRRVSQLDWRIIEVNCDKPFIASGLSFTPLPVMHGEDYVALGFFFGHKSKVAYISDVSRIPPSTEYAISKEGAGQLDLLILDTNIPFKRGLQPTHICFPEALEIIKRLCPKRALLTGMTHDFDHHEYNEMLAEWSLRQFDHSEKMIDLRLFDHQTKNGFFIILVAVSYSAVFDSGDERRRRVHKLGGASCVHRGVASVKTLPCGGRLTCDLSHAVDRSQGGLVEIDICYIGTDSLLNYIADRSSNLRSLRLAMCSTVTSEGLTEAIAKLPLLEDLEVSYCSLSAESLKVVGQSCPNLKTLKLNREGTLRLNSEPDPKFYDEEALGIAESMPELRHLQLFGNILTNTGLTAILDGYPHQEHLDLRNCFNRCSERIKVVRRPDDSTHDYPYDVLFYDSGSFEHYYPEDHYFPATSDHYGDDQFYYMVALTIRESLKKTNEVMEQIHQPESCLWLKEWPKAHHQALEHEIQIFSFGLRDKRESLRFCESKSKIKHIIHLLIAVIVSGKAEDDDDLLLSITRDNKDSSKAVPDKESLHDCNDEEAPGIAESMPELRHIQLFGNILTNTGLTAILDGCPHLEHLDLRKCFNVRLEGDLEKRCSERIKDLKTP
ncbi:hypothetical protein HID58_084216, partial [Brassica napus]